MFSYVPVAQNRFYGRQLWIFMEKFIVMDSLIILDNFEVSVTSLVLPPAVPITVREHD